jgi:hypothetical protein
MQLKYEHRPMQAEQVDVSATVQPPVTTGFIMYRY